MKALEGQVKPENLLRVAARTWPELLAERIVRRSGGTSPTGEGYWSGLCVLKTKQKCFQVIEVKISLIYYL